MSKLVSMADDPRPIKAIWMIGADQEMTDVVGQQGVTRIVVYGEPREMAMVPWLAVYKGDHLWSRIKASACQIMYAEEAADEQAEPRVIEWEEFDKLADCGDCKTWQQCVLTQQKPGVKRTPSTCLLWRRLKVYRTEKEARDD